MIALPAPWAHPPRRGIVPLILAALLLLLLLPAIAWGQASQLNDRELELEVQRISDQLRCPTCQGSSVKDSDASFSRQIRDKVRVMVKEGQTEDMIKAYFVTRYGEWILRAPKKEGLGLVLWYSPVVLLVGVGFYLGWRVHRNNRSRKAPAPVENVPAPASNPQDFRARLAQDLKRFEEQD